MLRKPCSPGVTILASIALLSLGPRASAAEFDDSFGPTVKNLPRHVLDEAAALASGVRKLTGKHATLLTDLPARSEVDALPEVLDQAFPQWCGYFGVSAAEHSSWRVTAFLIGDKARCVRAGLLPDFLPAFAHGFSYDDKLWLYEQSSDYYRRHLFLHEGTHAFMNTLLGSAGPRWYMECTAELLATHRWHDGRLTLDVFPARRDDVPMWGRIEAIGKAVAKGHLLTIPTIIDSRLADCKPVERYAWVWALGAFLDGHPAYRDRFRTLPGLVLRSDFNPRFHALFADDWPRLNDQWQVFAADLQYGHDLSRSAIAFSPGAPLAVEGKTVTVAADRGWQSAGVRLEANASYRLKASGRYQLATRPEIWWCEPNGVSIRYHQGRPLGILLAAVRPDEASQNCRGGLMQPTVIGLGATLVPEQSGTLYLKINDSPAELADNAGQLSVEIRRDDAR